MIVVKENCIQKIDISTDKIIPGCERQLNDIGGDIRGILIPTNEKVIALWIGNELRFAKLDSINSIFDPKYAI